jgi:hypothetical protein
VASQVVLSSMSDDDDYDDCYCRVEIPISSEQYTSCSSGNPSGFRWRKLPESLNWRTTKTSGFIRKRLGVF